MTAWADAHPALVIAGLVALCAWILALVVVLCAYVWAEVEYRQSIRDEHTSPAGQRLAALEEAWRR